jgi:FkbM family methyltransferase
MTKTTKIDRRSVLLGSLAGVAVGGGAGFASGAVSQRGRTTVLVPPFDPGVKQSWAQQGEDLVVRSMLAIFKIERPRYVDVGAHHPSINSNTFLFYQAGGRGLLVEPNPTYAQLIRERRPGDTVLEAGIGVTSEKEADYYVFGGDGQLNTFSKDQADELVRLNGSRALKKVIKRELVNVNEALAKAFPDGGPDFFSIDVEGLDYAILKTLDFERFRPLVFCVETSTLEGDLHRGIVDLMATKDFLPRGGSFVNTVFLDERARKLSSSRHPGE